MPLTDLCLLHNKLYSSIFKFLIYVSRWKRKVSGPVVYVRRELAIIQFCAMVARNGFINDIVE